MAYKGTNHKGGRPKGSITQIERDRLDSLAYMKEQVIAATQKILNSQIGLAVGSQYLFKITSYKGQRSEPILVKEQSEMEAYLRGDFDKDPEDDDKKTRTTYYFLTGKDPDNKAIDSLFNRVHGRPKETLDVNTPNGNLVTIVFK